MCVRPRFRFFSRTDLGDDRSDKPHFFFRFSYDFSPVQKKKKKTVLIIYRFQPDFRFSPGATTENLPPEVLYRVVATYKYDAEDTDELSFDKGEIINVVAYDDPETQVCGYPAFFYYFFLRQ